MTAAGVDPVTEDQGESWRFMVGSPKGPQFMLGSAPPPPQQQQPQQQPQPQPTPVVEPRGEPSQRDAGVADPTAPVAPLPEEPPTTKVRVSVRVRVGLGLGLGLG